MSHDVTVVFICDRCGARVEGPCDAKLADQPLPMGWRRVVRPDGRFADLCQSCRDDFDDFMASAPAAQVTA